MLDTMTDNELLGLDETDGGTSMTSIGSDHLLDEDTHSFTGDDDLETTGMLTSIFDRPLDESSPPTSPPRRLSGNSDLRLSDSDGMSPMRNDIEEEEWRDDARDLPHRKETLLHVANFLLARKRNPTKEWLKELPYKARKLEEQLYKGAPSLPDYLDKASLKHRLKRVAKNIVTQYRQAKARRACLNGMSPPSSMHSTSSSVASSNPALFLAMQDATPRQSNIKSLANHVGSFHSNDPRTSSMSSMRSLSSPGAAGLSAFSMMNGDQGRRHSSSLSVNLDASTFSQDPQCMNNRMGFSSNGVIMSQQQPAAASLEERQLANKKLQQQILENIRQQQQLMRELMVQTNKSKMSRGIHMNGMHPPQAQVLNIANSSPNNNTSVTALAQSILLQGNHLPHHRHSLNMMSNQQRQLPTDLLQQSLTGGGSATNNSMQQMQQQQRNVYHPGMPPPNSRQSLNGGMYDDNTSYMSQAPNAYPW